MTSFTRSWSEKDKSFVVKSKQGRENFYANAAVALATGEAILSKKPDACTKTMNTLSITKRIKLSLLFHIFI